MTCWNAFLDAIVVHKPRRSRGAALTLLAVVGLTGCDVGTDPVDPATVTVSFSLPVAGELIGRVDRVHIRMSAAGEASPLIDTTFTVAGSATGPFQLEVPLQNKMETVTALIELFGGGSVLFSGESTASLESGLATSVSVAAAPVPAAVVLQKEVETFTAIGNEVVLQAFVTLASGDTIPGLVPTLSTGDPSVAVVQNGNTIRSTGEGTTEVTATYEDKSDVTPILVEAVVVGITVEPEVLTVPLGMTAAFEAAARDANGNPLVRDATWSSNDDGIATVAPDGSVTPLRLGEVGVMVQIEGFPATAMVEVTPGPASVAPQEPEAIGTRVVTLKGEINPNGAAATAWFEWSANEDFSGSTSTDPQSIAASTTTRTFTRTIKGLSPSTTYFVRVRASNVGGASVSDGASFTTADPTGGFIEGRVTVESEALAGATLSLSGGGSTETDDDGRFSFEDVPLGSYSISISGFPADVQFAPASRSAEIGSIGQVVTTDFSGEFIRTSTITGSVTASGTGVGGVSVTLGGPDSGITTTDGSGQYTFSSIRSGSYSLSVSGFDPDSVAFTSTSASTSVGIGQTRVVNFPGVDLGIQTVSVFAFVGIDGSKPGVSPVAGVQIDLYPTLADAGALSNRLGRTTTSSAGRADFVFDRGNDTGESGGKTDNTVYSVVTGMPGGNLGIQADSLMTISYGQTEINALAGDTVDIVNGDVTLVFYLQTIFTSYGGPEGTGLFKPGWTTRMYTDTTSGSVASTVTPQGGRSTFPVSVPVSSLPVTYYFRADDSQPAAAGNTWTQTPEATSNGSSAGRFLKYVHDGTGPSSGVLNVGTERLRYLTQSLFTPVYHEVDNATASPQWTSGSDSHDGAGNIRVEVAYSPGGPAVRSQSAASNGHVVWNGVFDSETILYVRAYSTNPVISVITGTEYTVGFQGGGSVGAFGPGAGGFRHSARVCPLSADTAIANCHAFAYKYNNTEITTNVSAGGGGGVGGMSVVLYRCAPPNTSSCNRDGEVDTKTTNGSGNVVFRDLLEGIYEVAPDPGSAGYGSVTPDGGTPIVVTSGSGNSVAKDFTANP